MMRYWNKGIVPLLAALCLLLSGCGNQFDPAIFTTTAGIETAAGPEDAPGSGDAPEPEEVTGPEEASEPVETQAPASTPEAAAKPNAASEGLFESILGSYMFCSGAGGWSTTMTLEADGSFTGLFQDSDMGAADPEKYPDGTRYVCNFSGKFTQPVKTDGTIWSMEIESLELAHPADESEEYADGVRYIYSGPYGLENAEELLIYLPSTPADDVPEEVLWAAKGPYDWKPTQEGALGLTIIYNVHEGQGFAQYPLV